MSIRKLNHLFAPASAAVWNNPVAGVVALDARMRLGVARAVFDLDGADEAMVRMRGRLGTAGAAP